MKFSIALTALILVTGLLPGLLYQKRSAETAGRRAAVRAEAEKLGVRLESAQDREGPRSTKRRRPGATAASRDAAAGFLGFAAELEARGGDGGLDDEMNRRGHELVAKIASLGPDELRDVLEDLREASGISAQTRRQLVGYIVLTLSSRDPEVAAKVALESADLLGDSVVGEQALLMSIQRWAAEDPDAARNWIGQSASKSPDLQDEDVMRSLVGGIARKDPAEAFRVIGNLGLDDEATGVAEIMEVAAESPARRDEVLAALRGHLGGLASEADRDSVREEAFSTLAQSIDAKDFEASKEWLEGANLDDGELAAFATGLGYFDAEGATGEWIEWFSSRLEMDDLEDPVQEMMSEWTQQDYLAAGNWLAGAPESAGKRAAVAAYAEAVAEYEPRVAVQWAMTLPETWRRESVLRTIHENWPENDPQGAEDFARDHNIR